MRTSYAVRDTPWDSHEQRVVEPQVLHFRQVPLRTSVKLPHSPHELPIQIRALSKSIFDAI